MKSKLRFVVYLFAFAMLTFSCGTQSKQKTITLDGTEKLDEGYSTGRSSVSTHSSNQVKPTADEASSLSIADMLRRVNGLIVSGSGENVSVKLRGAMSLNADTRPLFVVNGNNLGNNVSDVIRAVNPNDIKSIRLVKDSEASIYGSRGANGVILIRLK